jgi:hypothetical protein
VLRELGDQDPIAPTAIRKSKERIKLIYHTTPHRGLQILVPVFEKLCEWHDDIELDVFSRRRRPVSR